MSEHVDAVVIGSGFGGSVTAARLAADKRRVVVLERGRSYPPGSFKRTPSTIRELFWDPGDGLQGIYNVWHFRKLSAVVCSGLGGGSLIYANVLLRKDEKWFQDQEPDGTYRPWPVTRAILDPHYEIVERAMNAQCYPLAHEPYKSVEKVRAFRQAVEAMAKGNPSRSLVTPPLAITFANDGRPPVPGETIIEAQRNLHDQDRRTCMLCGECCVGCNYGAKNTLDYTYLSVAKHAGADLRTLCEVLTFKQLVPDKRFEVTYVKHREDGAPAKLDDLPRHTITCDRLILSAGTLGSTRLLLRNLAAFPAIKRDVVGTRFSGNGDLLTFALRCTRQVDGKQQPWMLEATRGPTITSTLHEKSVLDTGDAKDGPGLYVQDAGFPKEIAWLLEGLDGPGWISRGWRFLKRLLAGIIGRNRDPDLAAELARVVGNGVLTGSSVPLLGMGRDVPEGRLKLDGTQLALDWSGARSAAYFKRSTDAAREIVAAMGGEFMLNPQARFLKRALTVHPLGGCPMGASADEGVVDSHGEVFGHPGFFILDGSVLPGPVGPNPSLTIAAVTDRAVTHMIEHWPRT